MKGFIGNIEDLTKENSYFRKVLYTGENLQLVLMALKPGEDIGEEVHEDRDQFFRFEKGHGEVRIDGVTTKINKDDAVIVPAGAKHNVINTGSELLRFYTIYGPPEHADALICKTKEEALSFEEHYDGITTELHTLSH